jgi:hypothetical protein
LDRIANYLGCVLSCALPGMITIAGIHVAFGLLMTALALVGIATIVTIPEIWVIIAGAYGLAVAALIALCLVTCGFPREPVDASGQDNTDGTAGAQSSRWVRLPYVGLGLLGIGYAAWRILGG